MLLRPHVIRSYWTSNISRKSYDDRIYDLTGTRPNCYLWSSHVSSSSFATFCAWRSMNPLISTCCVSPSTGEDHHEDRVSPFPTKSKNTEIDSKKNFSENDIVGIAQVRSSWRCFTVDCSSLDRWWCWWWWWSYSMVESNMINPFTW